MQLRSLQSIFRALVVASTVSVLLVLAGPWLIWDSAPLETYRALIGRGVGAVFPLAPSFVWLLVALRLAVTVGLCRFNPQARFVFASLAGLDLVLLLLGGVVTGTAIEAFLATSANLMNGAIIALSYFSPLKRRFDASPERRAQRRLAREAKRERRRGVEGRGRREAEGQRVPSALDRLLTSERIQRLHRDYLGAIRSRSHAGICRSRFIRAVRNALSSHAYFRKGAPATSGAAE